jgi:hypothetical protein
LKNLKKRKKLKFESAIYQQDVHRRVATAPQKPFNYIIYLAINQKNAQRTVATAPQSYLKKL